MPKLRVSDLWFHTGLSERLLQYSRDFVRIQREPSDSDDTDE